MSFRFYMAYMRERLVFLARVIQKRPSSIKYLAGDQPRAQHMILALLLAAASWVPVASDARHQIVELQIQKPNDPQHSLFTFCSGVIVQLRPVWILTEEHCLLDPYDKFDVYADGIRVKEVRRKDEGRAAHDSGLGHGPLRQVEGHGSSQDPHGRARGCPPSGTGATIHSHCRHLLDLRVERPARLLQHRAVAGMSGGAIVATTDGCLAGARGGADVPGSPMPSRSVLICPASGRSSIQQVRP